MSGGHFNYTQYQLTQIADDIEQLIIDNDNEEKNEWGDVTGRHYTAETIAAFQTTVEMLRQSYTYVQRVDWLVSGDDGEEGFHTRLRKELKEKHMSGDHNMNQYRHKPWVGLTEEEVEQVFPAIATYHAENKTLYHSIARAIEAKLKEKNT